MACRVLADGEELFADPDLRADQPPVALALPVAGKRRLELIVDYGLGQDTGDRLVWADARLYREAPPKPETPEAEPETPEADTPPSEPSS